jgi:hypothetical protein
MMSMIYIAYSHCSFPITEIYGFVPQVSVGGFPFPFLACDIDKIDQVRRDTVLLFI